MMSIIQNKRKHTQNSISLFCWKQRKIFGIIFKLYKTTENIPSYIVTKIFHCFCSFKQFQQSSNNLQCYLCVYFHVFSNSATYWCHSGLQSIWISGFHCTDILYNQEVQPRQLCITNSKNCKLHTDITYNNSLCTLNSSHPHHWNLYEMCRIR